MLTIVTPATSTALTTVDRARSLLDFPASMDPVVGSMIAQASRAVVNHCRRSFGIVTAREIFALNDLCGDGPLLSLGPAVAFDSVRINGDALDEGQYAYDAVRGRLLRLDADGTPMPWWGGTLVVEYQAGYVLPAADNADVVTLPETVERAAILLVGTYLSFKGRDPLIKSEAVEGIGTTAWWVPGEGSDIPSPEAVMLLREHIRFWP